MFLKLYKHRHLILISLTMPRGTRSQQPELVPPFTPSANRTTRPPKKPRQPTQKAKDTAQQLKDRREERERDKIRDEARHAARGAYHHSSEEGRRLRAEYAAELQRKGDVTDRVRANKEREARAWSAEVAQFGEPEARRRRDEEREEMINQDNLPTSELKDLHM